MKLSAAAKADIKSRPYAMYTPDGNLRVADMIIANIEDGTPHEDLWDRVAIIVQAVLADGDWCAEAQDTAVEEQIFVALEAHL